MTIPQEAIEAAAEQFSAHVHGEVDFEALTEEEQNAALVATNDIIDVALPAIKEEHLTQVLAVVWADDGPKSLDGLTDEEREEHAKAWREGQGKPPTPEELRRAREWADRTLIAREVRAEAQRLQHDMDKHNQSSTLASAFVKGVMHAADIIERKGRGKK